MSYEFADLELETYQENDHVYLATTLGEIVLDEEELEMFISLLVRELHVLRQGDTYNGAVQDSDTDEDLDGFHVVDDLELMEYLNE